MGVKILKSIVAIALLALLVKLVSFEDLWSALSHLTVGSAVYLLFLSGVMIYVSALKWGFFLESFGAPVSVLKLFNLYLVGYFVNLLLPSYIGGDVVRSWYVGKDVGQHQALAATILERYTGIVAMLALALGFVWIAEGVTMEIKCAVVCVSFGVVVASIISYSPWLLGRLSGIRPLAKVVAHLMKVQDALRLASKDRALFCKALGLSFLFHSLTVLNTIAAAHAVGWQDPPVFSLFIVLPLILLVGALPLSPSGLGIQEGAFFFFLHSVGATPAQAFGVGVVLRAKSYVLAMLGWGAWARYHKQQPSNVTAAT